jgi:hypothetical protein
VGAGDADYVQHYDLARSEGIVLRYLSDAFKAVNQAVPESARPTSYDISERLREFMRQFDSSLLDEWKALVHLDAVPVTDRSAPLRRR